MEQRKDLSLGKQLKVDQHVAAADKVHFCKGRFANHILTRENNHLSECR